MILEPGRICLKIAGREASKYCVVVDNIDDSFVLITGPKSITQVKRRKCNVLHLEPTQEKFDINSKTEDSLVEDLWRKSGLIEKFGIEIPVKKEKSKTRKVKKVEK